MEEYAYILDFLPHGLPGNNFSKREPVCYAIGNEEFKLFELVPRADAQITIDEKVYIGKDATLRTQIDHVKRRVGYNDLTATASGELEYVVKEIVEGDQKRFIRFYNEAGPISIKKHLLEELPGIGKKSVTEILNARKNGPFVDFDDMKKRVPVVKDPAKLITDRIVIEISDYGRRHYLFVVK